MVRNVARRVLSAIIAALVLTSAATVLRASPVTFIYTGVGSGDLGGDAFGPSAFTITATGDTTNITSPPGLPQVLILEHDFASIDIADLGVLNFVSPTQTFFNTTLNTAGFQTLTDPLGLDLFDLTSRDLAGWDLASPIGPVSGTGTLLQWDTVITTVENGGIEKPLQFTNALTDFHFTADASPVPLPPALPLFASMLALFGLLRWRNRRKVAATA